MTWCLWCSGSCMPGCEPGGKGSTPFGYPFDLHECAPGRAGSLQNCFTGFNSSRSCSCPDGVAERIVPSEGSGPGSNPGRDTDSRSLRVWRIARQFSKLHDEVQLLGGLLRDLRPRGVLDWHATLRRLRSRFDFWRGRFIDAGARRYGGCLQSSIPVGSTPTGVSFEARLRCRLTSGTLTQEILLVRRVPKMACNRATSARLAQLAEHQS